MAKDVDEEIVDGPADASLGPPREQNELDPQQRDQDEGGPHRLHVGRGLSTVCLLQLGDQHPHNVQEEEKVHLDGQTVAGRKVLAAQYQTKPDGGRTGCVKWRWYTAGSGSFSIDTTIINLVMTIHMINKQENMEFFHKIDKIKSYVFITHK